MRRFKLILSVTAIIAIIGIAGNHDWASEVLENVPTEVYKTIKKDMGGNPSDVKIAEYYLANKAKYDSITNALGW